MEENTNTTNVQANENQEQEQKQVVLIAEGAGTEPIEVPWVEGMTVTTALEAAEIELEEGETAVIGETMIENPDETLVEPGQMIVIDSMPANG